MERENTKSSIYLCYNSNKVMKQAARRASSSEEEHDYDGFEEHDGCCYVDHHHLHHHGHDGGMMMMTWPPRSYTCSFCKREFRSAQALGGHMNVHRRDRANLRQLAQQLFPNNFPSPHLNLNLNLPPNVDGDTTSLIRSRPLITANKFQQHPSPPPPPPHDAITRQQFECFRRKNNLVGFKRQEASEEGNHATEAFLNKGGGNGKTRVDFGKNIKDDLDLELRLGYK